MDQPPDKDPLTKFPVSPSSRLRDVVSSARFARILEGASIGIAMWCILLALRLLPGFTADTPGVLLFAVLGAVVSATPLRAALLATVVVGVVLILVVTETSISNVVASRWLREDRYPNAAVDAAVALSASVNPNGTMSSEALDNVLTGLALVREGKAKTLVTTTVDERFPGGLVSSRPDQSRIVGLFGGQDKWLSTPPTQSTRDEAIKSAQILLTRGVRRIAVVTAPMHTRRACSAFEAVGFAVTCVPALARAPGGKDPGPWPADRLRVFGDWAYEIAATFEYRSRGWLAR